MWAESVCSNQTLTGLTFADFSAKLKTVFDHPDHVGNSSKRLFNLRQGSNSVAEYSIEFWTLAADSKWNEEALQGAFLNGLNESIKDKLATRDEPADLHSLVSLSIKLDNRLRERRRERGGQPHLGGQVSQPSTSQVSPPRSRLPPVPGSIPRMEEEPMQVDRARLPPTVRQQRLQARECLYCGDATHILATCPKRPKDKARS